MKLKILFIACTICLLQFAQAQQKSLPNKAETRSYVNKMIIDARYKTYITTQGNSYDVPYLSSYSYNRYEISDQMNNNSLAYDYGPLQLDCTWMGRYNEQTAKRKIIFRNFDIRKLSSAKISSSNTSAATALQVTLTFENKNIESHIEYYGEFGLACKLPPQETNKINYIEVYIPNEEGSFERFKKAIFHYKDLLIAEDKQKLADDPFAN